MISPEQQRLAEIDRDHNRESSRLQIDRAEQVDYCQAQGHLHLLLATLMKFLDHGEDPEIEFVFG